MAKTNIEEIKSVPKYILKKIQSLDKKQYGNEKYLRFYAYLSKWKKHLISVDFPLPNFPFSIMVNPRSP